MRWNVPGGESRLASELRQFIGGALHMGTLRAGDRLPSIRRIGRIFGVTSYAALQAYGCLEAEGLVERRERSGVFLSAHAQTYDAPLPETAAWLADTLAQASEHQLKIPALPELVTRWTHARPLRCACVESCEDARTAFCTELAKQFGVETFALPATTPLPQAPGAPALRDADVVVTTAFHAAPVRAAAERLGKPFLVAPVNPDLLAAAEQHLRTAPLSVVCVDPAFGSRLRDSISTSLRQRVRIVSADDTDAVQQLDSANPVFLTIAARSRIARSDLRLVCPPSPSYSLSFARRFAGTVVRLHIAAERA